MKILRRVECKTVDKYLGQFDFHSHAFSNCVFNKMKGITEVKQMRKEEKSRLYSHSLEDLCNNAVGRGVKILGVTDHPDFSKYDVRFNDFTEVFEKIRKKFSDKLVLLRGLEVNVKIDEKNSLYLDYAEISDRNTPFWELVKHIDYFIGSTHHKYFIKHTLERNRKAYFGFIKETIDILSGFRARVKKDTRQEKLIILGHPYSFIGEANYTEHDSSENLKKKYQTKSQYLNSPDCLIKPFDGRELRPIVERLIGEKIFTEINGLTIRKGHSDIRKTEPIYMPIAGYYLDYCKQNSIRSSMFVNSDAHKGEDIANFELDSIKKVIGEERLDLIRIPYQKFLR